LNPFPPGDCGREAQEGNSDTVHAERTLHWTCHMPVAQGDERAGVPLPNAFSRQQPCVIAHAIPAWLKAAAKKRDSHEVVLTMTCGRKRKTRYLPVLPCERTPLAAFSPPLVPAGRQGRNSTPGINSLWAVQPFEKRAANDRAVVALADTLVRRQPCVIADPSPSGSEAATEKDDAHCPESCLTPAEITRKFVTQ